MTLVQFKKYLKRVTKLVSGPNPYPAGGFKVTIGELTKVKHASVKYIGNGEYIAQVLTKEQDGTLADNEVKIFVRDNIEQAVDEGGTATYTIGEEVGAVDLSGEKFLIEAEGY